MSQSHFAAFDIQRHKDWENLAFGAVLVSCATALLMAVLWIPLPFQLNFAEGPLLGAAAAIAHGSPAYPSPTTPPYNINPYGPIPYYVIAMVVKVFGVEFTAPRVVSMASAIACAGIIALLIRRVGGTVLVSVVFGALFLTMPSAQRWLAVLRVDMIGLAFSLSGIYLVLRFNRWSLSLVPFAAAFICKFSFVAAPAACFLHLLLTRGLGESLKYLGSLLALLVIAFLIIQTNTGGWFWFDTVLSSSIHSFSITSAVRRILGEFRDCWVLLIFVALAIWIDRNELLRGILRLPAFYFATSLVVMFARGKAGADSNYFLEWEAALCWCTGMAYSLLTRSESKAFPIWGRFAAPVLLAAQVFFIVAWVNLHRQLPLYQSLTGCRDAYHFVQNYPGDRILTDNVGATVLAGKTPGVSEPFLWARLVIQGGWSSKEMVELIRTQQFDLILLNRLSTAAFDAESDLSRWPDPVIEAIETNYNATRSFACVDAEVAYERKQRPDES
jgi:Dolichyl-phosphate-mannose-protein mannosyltransferase